MADRYDAKTGDDLGNKMVGMKLKTNKRKFSLKRKKKLDLEKFKNLNKKRRHQLLERTLQYEKEYAEDERKIVELKREARKNGCFYKEAEPKVVFVIRIKGVNKIPPKVRSVFRLLRLLQLHNGTFVKVNKASKQLLKIVEPYVTYGYVSLPMIRKLIYKRGYLRFGKNGKYTRKRIQHNSDICARLGKYGIYGVEDIVYQIYKCGKYFTKVNRALWTFKLKPPKKGFKAKRHGFNEPRKGDWGNREELINELLKRMI